MGRCHAAVAAGKWPTKEPGNAAGHQRRDAARAWTERSLGPDHVSPDTAAGPGNTLHGVSYG
jgi:hypothetical protein